MDYVACRPNLLQYLSAGLVARGQYVSRATSKFAEHKDLAS
jgi:hypothetical protein